jgi:hypothetical protein
MKVGVLELLSDSVSQSWIEGIYNGWFRRHYASITPQAVAVWCRQLGHTVSYATYYGQQDPKSLLPNPLDVVFIATYTQASALAYALAKLYRRDKTLTVIGGPHARSFPLDCLRFFDLVVHDCDKTLIDDVLRGSYDRNTIVTSGRRLEDIPSVEERLPEISIASFSRGRPTLFSNIPILTSLGCPYRCDFCVDWVNPYVLLPSEQVAADLRYVSKHMAGIMISYHDPNFGVKFDQVMNTIETVPKNARNPYIMETSLSVLQGSRMRRLGETNCTYAAPGIESWVNYSNKAGVGSTVGKEKLARVAAHLEELYQYVPGLQVNFMFGTDRDKGDEPVELTKEFIRRLPFVWPTMNIPVPFGGTPLYDSCLAEDRILRSMPFCFYYNPYLVIKPKKYHPLEYYEKLIEIYSVANSGKMLMRRVLRTRKRGLKTLHVLRTLSMWDELSKLRRIRWRLTTDAEFRAFHEGRSNNLPDFYRRGYKERLGHYADLISEVEMSPELEPLSSIGP